MAVAEAWEPSHPARWGVVRETITTARWVNLLAIGAFVAVTVIAVAAPWLAPYDPLRPVGRAFIAPGHDGFLFGTDAVGRDVLSRVLVGVRTTWLAGLIVIASGVVIGSTVGLIAGACGGLIDGVLMRLTDLFLALPAPILAIAVVAALGPGLVHMVLAVVVVWWPFYARIVRGEVRALMVRPHLEAARLAGTSSLRRGLRHLLPGTMPAVLVTASLDVGNVVLTFAGLSFLGLGPPQPAPELGSMAAQNLSYILQQWWIGGIPAIIIAVLALLGNLSGDAVRDLMKDR